MLERLLANTKQNGECMEWLGLLNTDGYPRKAPNIKVHRLVWELTNNKNPNGSVVRHTCDNRICINPEHLVIGTASDNTKDRQDRGRTYSFVPIVEVNLVHHMYECGIVQTEIAKRLSVNRRRIEYILTKRVPVNQAGG